MYLHTLNIKINILRCFVLHVEMYSSLPLVGPSLLQ